MDVKYKYHWTCTEKQAKGLINLLIEDSGKIMIEVIRIYPHNFSTSYYDLIDTSEWGGKSFSEDKEKFENYLKSVKLLQKESEESKVMPLTRVIYKGDDSDIKNYPLFCMENEEISQIYNNLTDVSKLLNGWRVGSIHSKELENTKEIIRTKRLVSNLLGGYYLSSFEILLHPWIRTADHYCDYLECYAKLSFYEGKVEIESEEELFKLKKKLKSSGISLENCIDEKLLLEE